MSMIGQASNCHRVDAVALGNACHIGPQLRLDLLLNGMHAVFRAKHDMNVMGNIRAGHCGYLHSMLAYPSKPWLKGALNGNLWVFWRRFVPSLAGTRVVTYLPPGTPVPGSGVFRP